VEEWGEQSKVKRIHSKPVQTCSTTAIKSIDGELDFFSVSSESYRVVLETARETQRGIKQASWRKADPCLPFPLLLTISHAESHLGIPDHRGSQPKSRNSAPGSVAKIEADPCRGLLRENRVIRSGIEQSATDLAAGWSHQRYVNERPWAHEAPAER
jgi:hypothetical protein